MAVANNWEVLIARGIVTAKKTEIIVIPTDPPPVTNKMFMWGISAKWKVGVIDGAE